MHIDEFFAEHPDAEETSSSKKTVQLVSGDYDKYGHATASATFCRHCGEQIECLECENSECYASPLYTGEPVKCTAPCYP